MTPEKLTGGFKIGVIPSATLGSTGSKSITGVGFKPRLVKFYSLVPASDTDMSYGNGAMDDSGSQFAVTISATGSYRGRNSSQTSAYILKSAASGSWVNNFSYVSMDSDGFTINVVTATSSVPVAFEAYG